MFGTIRISLESADKASENSAGIGVVRSRDCSHHDRFLKRLHENIHLHLENHPKIYIYTHCCEFALVTESDPLVIDFFQSLQYKIIIGNRAGVG